MNHEELEKRIDEILLKQTRGERLTKQEEKILAYGYYAAVRQPTTVWVRPPRDAQHRRRELMD